MLLCSHLAGDAGDVAVEPGPAAVALAAVQVVGLPALPPVLAGRGVAPAHQVLGGESKGWSQDPAGLLQDTNPALHPGQ